MAARRFRPLGNAAALFAAGDRPSGAGGARSSGWASPASPARLPATGLEQLTNYAEPVEGQLLPDDRLLLEIDEGGNERTQLYLDGEPLVVDPRFIHRSPHVSRDGTLLGYATNRRNGLDFDIVVRRLESGEERTFELGGLCAAGDISPDGRWAVAGQYGELSGDSNLFLLGIESRRGRARDSARGAGRVHEPGLAPRLLRLRLRDERGPRHLRRLPVHARRRLAGRGRVGLGPRVLRRRARATAARRRERGRLLADRRPAAAGRGRRGALRLLAGRGECGVRVLHGGGAVPGLGSRLRLGRDAEADRPRERRGRRRTGAAPGRELRRRARPRLPVPARR